MDAYKRAMTFIVLSLRRLATNLTKIHFYIVSLTLGVFFQRSEILNLAF